MNYGKMLIVALAVILISGQLYSQDSRKKGSDGNIKELEWRIKELESANKKLDWENQALRQKLDDLERRIESLESIVNRDREDDWGDMGRLNDETVYTIEIDRYLPQNDFLLSPIERLNEIADYYCSLGFPEVCYILPEKGRKNNNEQEYSIVSGKFNDYSTANKYRLKYQEVLNGKFKVLTLGNQHLVCRDEHSQSMKNETAPPEKPLEENIQDFLKQFLKR